MTRTIQAAKAMPVETAGNFLVLGAEGERVAAFAVEADAHSFIASDSRPLMDFVRMVANLETSDEHIANQERPLGPSSVDLPVGIDPDWADSNIEAMDSLIAKARALIKGEIEETEQEIEDRLLKMDSADMLRLIDWIANKIGLPHDEELSQINFAQWLASLPKDAQLYDESLHGRDDPAVEAAAKLSRPALIAAAKEAEAFAAAITASRIFVVAYNHDYNESVLAFHTRAEAVADIASTFECEEAPDTADFWQEVSDNYENGNWKGFQFLSIDPVTLAITEEER